MPSIFTTPEEAQRMIENLLLAAQGYGKISLRSCVSDLYLSLTGDRPSEETLREMDVA